MHNIKITDLFGINILNNRDIRDNKNYIIINFINDNIDDLLIAINQYNGNYIYKLNFNAHLFSKIKQKYKFDINDYIELGNYIIYNNNDIKILLMHKNAGIKTNRYTLIDVVGNLYLWKPISINNEYTNLGVVITTDEYEIPYGYIGLVNTEFIKISEPININSDILFENDYSLLGTIKNNKRKLLSIKILKNNENIEHIEHFENISTECDINKNDIDHNDIDQNDIINHHNNLNVYKGKRLVLVESDNPWYINKDNVIELKYIKNDNYFGVRSKYPVGAKFKSNTVYNPQSPNLGYGYSYADRKDVIIEKFSDNENNNANYVILVMIFIIVLLMVYNFYKNKKMI
jgi:hypothetical protein